MVGREVLSTSSSSRGFVFNLAGLVITRNKDWFDGAYLGGLGKSETEEATDGAAELEMKKQLRFGGPDALNIYSVGFKAPPNEGAKGLLGYATYP